MLCLVINFDDETLVVDAVRMTGRTSEQEQEPVAVFRRSILRYSISCAVSTSLTVRLSDKTHQDRLTSCLDEEKVR